MTANLKAAVLAHVGDARALGPYAPSLDAPVFRRYDDGTVEHVSGRPAITAVTVDLLDAADGTLDWDGECLTMPGNLRYRPIGLDRDGLAVVCERVGE